MEDWLEQSGAVGLDALEIANFPGIGRGVKTVRRFKEGDRILTIQSSVLWTVEHAFDDPLLGPALRSAQPPLSPDDTLAVYILFVRSCETDYARLRSHLALLPKSYSSSIFFMEDELRVCAGSSLYTITEQLKHCIEADYRALVVRLFGQYPELFPLEKFTLEDYKWALCSVWSRGMDFRLPDGKSIRLMAPFADMFNHSSRVRQCHAYDLSSGNLSILAGTDYEAGDQVFINYGPIPNNRLLRLYGFVIPSNPNDSYDLVLNTHPMAPLYEEKHKLWLSAGLDSTSTVSLTLADPLPNDVLRYLRIQRAHESDLDLLARGRIDPARGKISDSNEAEVLRSLVESFSGLLDGFGTSAEKLEESLTAGVYPVGGNAWAAAHVSLGEQRVLRLAREQAEKMLAALEGGSGHKKRSESMPVRCANCRKHFEQLMACGRCKAVEYCGRTCQVAHYKEHKVDCRSLANSNHA